MSRQHLNVLLWGAAGVVVVLLAFAWFAPSNSYLYVPNEASPVASKVKVQGEKRISSGPGAIYYVDVSIRKATWAERALAFTRPDGATLVPKNVVVPAGGTFEDRRAEGLREMARSESVAAAVALRHAGYSVKATPKGALVESVASDAPAASVLHAGDVIVRAGARTIKTPEELRHSFDDVHPGSDVALRIRRDKTTKGGGGTDG